MKDIKSIGWICGKKITKFNADDLKDFMFKSNPDFICNQKILDDFI